MDTRHSTNGSSACLSTLQLLQAFLWAWFERRNPTSSSWLSNTGLHGSVKWSMRTTSKSLNSTLMTLLLPSWRPLWTSSSSTSFWTPLQMVKPQQLSITQSITWTSTRTNSSKKSLKGPSTPLLLGTLRSGRPLNCQSSSNRKLQMKWSTKELSKWARTSWSSSSSNQKRETPRQKRRF